MKGQDPSSVSASLLGAPGSSRSGGAKGVLTSHGAFLGMAVTAAVIEVGLDPPIKGLDPLVSEVCGRPLARVPIVRIYGPWGPGGPHCCLHLHGLFPYFYVPAPPEAYGDGASAFLRCFSRRLVLEADRLMAAKARGSQKGSRPAGTRASRDGFNDISLQREARAVRGDERPKGGPLVQKIEVVRRLPFYGYHRDFHFFLKISLTVPDMVGPMAALLLKGAVTGSPLQPFEVHLSFQVSSFSACLAILFCSFYVLYLAYCSFCCFCCSQLRCSMRCLLARLLLPFCRYHVIFCCVSHARGYRSPQGHPCVPCSQPCVQTRRCAFLWQKDLFWCLTASRLLPMRSLHLVVLGACGFVGTLWALQTQVFADLHLKGMAPVFVDKPFFRLPVVLHPLAAAGVQEGVQGSRLSTVSTGEDCHHRGSE